MDPRPLSVALRAVVVAAPEGNAKEPPSCHTKSVSALVAAAHAAFKYDWEDQLKAAVPQIAPMMRFTDYPHYFAKLCTAIRNLDAAPVASREGIAPREYADSATKVLAALTGLRALRHNENLHLREAGRGLNDAELKTEDMKALLAVAMVPEKDSPLRQALASAWLHSMLERDPLGDPRKTGPLALSDLPHNRQMQRHNLISELTSGLRSSLPGGAEFLLYRDALLQIEARDELRQRMAAAHIALIPR